MPTATRTQVEILREFAESLRDKPLTHEEWPSGEPIDFCQRCGEQDGEHDKDCPSRLARDALAAADEAPLVDEETMAPVIADATARITGGPFYRLEMARAAIRALNAHARKDKP